MSELDRKAIWQPPPRPDWVTRINAEGNCMDIRGVVPLDENSLLDTAMRNTGLSNFGSEEWREPFKVFVKSLDEEAELNLMGRLMGRSDVLMFLEARLQIEEAYQRHPDHPHRLPDRRPSIPKRAFGPLDLR